MADRSMLHTGEYLQLIQDTLLYLKQNPEATLSSADDCSYYRQAFKASMARKRAPTPEPIKNEPIKFEPIKHEPVKEPVYSAPPAPPAPMVVESVPVPSPIAALPVPKEIKKPIIESPPISSNHQSASVGLTNTPKTVTNDSLQWPILPFGKWKTLFSKIAPDVHILSEVPNDAIAKKIATRWKTKNLSAPITLLCYQEIPEQKALLEQIAIALDVHFAPAKLVSAETIEKEGQWETFLSVEALKLVIACDYTLWQMPGLLKFYKEANPKRLLAEKELFLLPDLSLYLKDPLLKRSLWKALCQICEPLLPPSS